METLHIDNERLTKETAAGLANLCPFGALVPDGNGLSITAACRMCKICVKQSGGVITLVKDDLPPPQLDKSLWRGIAVFADFTGGRLHPVTFELLGKARELSEVTGHPVFALLIGSNVGQAADTLLHYGADRVFVYDCEAFEYFKIEPFTNAFSDFIERVKPSSILVGATNVGRSLAPRVAARFKTGLTADCTRLEMQENTDLVQIRPAFGGNIMARIITPNHRPQFCTVRYKIFSPQDRIVDPSGEIVPLALPKEKLLSAITVLNVTAKPREVDISEAEAIVAVGRGIKKQSDLLLAQRLAEALGACLACTRPLIENGWFDSRHQIGLSGRTVKPKLIVTLGISGSVQFAAGMRGADCIIAVNTDPAAPIFDVAHYGLVGDIYSVLPRLLELTGRGACHVS